MNISTKAIVSNSEIVKNYKSCREKSDGFGKIFIFKNNQPDAVLFSIAEYERLSVIIEYLQHHKEKDIEEIINTLIAKSDECCLSDISENDIKS